MTISEFITKDYYKVMNICISKITNNNTALLLEYLRRVSRKGDESNGVFLFDIVESINLNEKQIKKCFKRLKENQLLEYSYFHLLDTYYFKLNNEKYNEICEEG